MENKLQQLTQKLYDEGLEKGRAEADRLVAEAKKEAAKIVAEARAQAEDCLLYTSSGTPKFLIASMSQYSK